MPLPETRNAPVDGLHSHAPSFTATDWVALALMIVGGINWGLVGLFDIDLVATLFGPMAAASRAVYVVVGIAALYGIVLTVQLGRRR